MADDATKQIREIMRKLDQLDDELSNSLAAESMALKTESIIKRRTRNGFGITEDLGSLTTLKNKKSTVKRRNELKEIGRLSNKTAPEVSNLTRTGHMLDKIHITSTQKNVFNIAPDKEDIRKVTALQKLGILFFGLTKQENAEVEKLGLVFVKAALKKLFK